MPAFGNEWCPRHMYLEGTPEFAHHRQGDTRTTLYATALAVPEDGQIRIETLREGSAELPGTISTVELLGGGEVAWERRDDALHLTLPEQPAPRHAVAFRITLEPGSRA